MSDDIVRPFLSYSDCATKYHLTLTSAHFDAVLVLQCGSHGLVHGHNLLAEAAPGTTWKREE